MLEKISCDGVMLALILRRNYHAEGIHFFTPENFSQQLAYMNRPKGYMIQPHVHNAVERQVQYTQEVLYIKSGEVKVSFYNENQVYVQDSVLYAGDVVLLAHGGHGFEIMENAEIIEVKQGPYAGGRDKVLFTPKKGEDNHL